MRNRVFDDSVVFRAAELFLGPDEINPEKICDELNKCMNENKQEDAELVKLIRSNFYRLIRDARKRGFIQLVPPVDRNLVDRLAAAYRHPKDSITVVDTMGKTANGQVSLHAATLALELIKTRIKVSGKSKVTLGLGPGRGTLDFCRHLGKLLADEKNVKKQDIKLRLVAISAGAPADQPEYASSSFYNLFPGKVESIGLFAETVVPAGSIKDKKYLPGIAEAYAEKDGIDLVVNSMGDLADPHDLLGAFLKKARDHGYPITAKLKTFLEGSTGQVRDSMKQNTIASVQYRPYDMNGPIIESDEEMRAFTVFELLDFVRVVKEGKDVILIARQCGQCGMSRAAGLHPLMTNPNLKVWSHLVMDSATARELVARAPVEPAPRGEPSTKRSKR